MSSEYAEKRIKEALRQSNGNTFRARELVMSWASEDNRLLQALVKPHINGIVAYNIERVASGRSEKAKHPEPPPPIQQSKDRFGMQILKAVVDANASVFGLDDTARTRRGASQSHVDAIRMLAEKGKSKE